MNLQGKYVNESDFAQLVKRDYEDAGLDLRSNEEVVIPPMKSRIVHTGVYVEIVPGFVGILKARSGLSVKNQIEVGAGVIDSGYRGELMAHLYNFSELNYFLVGKGDRIAQLLTLPVVLGGYRLVDKLSSSDRGDRGIGSSGVQ